MDRVELGIKLEQINKLRDKGDFQSAAKVADTIEWRKVKKWSELTVAADVYEKAGRLKDARNICVYAYNRNLGGKRLIYKLTELSIDIDDLEEADDLYNEYIEAAPRDMERYILLYKLNKARKVPVERLIEILEEYKQSELDEQYEYELASLYAEAGRTEDCIRECDDLILWFNEGEYVEKALRLKAKYAELTKSQKAKLEMMEEYRAAGMEYSTVAPDYDSEPDEEQETVRENGSESEETPRSGTAEEFRVPEKDYSIYDTQNVQAELAKSMALIMAGINGERPDDKNKEPDETAASAETASELSAEAALESSAVVDEIMAQAETLEQESIVTREHSRETVNEDEISLDADEPTKEIRINTHHWRRYRSVMVDEPQGSSSVQESTGQKESEAESAESGILPKYIVEETVTEAETDIQPQYVVEALETVVGMDNDIKQETAQAPESDGCNTEEESESESLEDEYLLTPITVEGESVTEENSAETGDGIETEAADTEAAAGNAGQNEDNTVKPVDMGEGTSDVTQQPIDGQLDLLQWLEDMPDTAEEQTATDEEEAHATESASDEEEAHTTESTATEDEIDAAMNEIASRLMAEVAAELDERQHQENPTAILEEEYADDTDAEAGDGEAADEYGVSEDEYEYDAYEDNNAGSEDAGATDSAGYEQAGPSKEEYEDDPENEGNDYVLKASERRYLQKYLFINGMEEAAAEIINSKKREKPDGTSAHGNIIVVGKAKTDKTEFAIDLFKALHSDDKNTKLRIAKTNAEAINSNGILASADKIKGATLIIENAGQLTKSSAKELAELMSSDTGAMLVIATGEDYAINRVFAENPRLSEMFDYRIEVRSYSVNELVTAAKEYARDKGYVIGEKALLRLYLLVGGIDSSDGEDALNRVREIVDDAIDHSGHRGRRHGARKNGGMVQLRERDFA